jgi:hypothetical protein
VFVLLVIVLTPSRTLCQLHFEYYYREQDYTQQIRCAYGQMNYVTGKIRYN